VPPLEPDVDDVRGRRYVRLSIGIGSHLCRDAFSAYSRKRENHETEVSVAIPIHGDRSRAAFDAYDRKAIPGGPGLVTICAETMSAPLVDNQGRSTCSASF